MLRGQPDSTPRWEHGRLGRQPEVQLSSKKAGTTLRLTVDYDDSQTAQHLLEQTHIEIEVRAYLTAPQLTAPRNTLICSAGHQAVLECHPSTAAPLSSCASQVDCATVGEVEFN